MFEDFRRSRNGRRVASECLTFSRKARETGRRMTGCVCGGEGGAAEVNIESSGSDTAGHSCISVFSENFHLLNDFLAVLAHSAVLPASRFLSCNLKLTNGHPRFTGIESINEDESQTQMMPSLG
jgi:hypothetical protein